MNHPNITRVTAHAMERAQTLSPCTVGLSVEDLAAVIRAWVAAGSELTPGLVAAVTACPRRATAPDVYVLVRPEDAPSATPAGIVVLAQSGWQWHVRTILRLTPSQLRVVVGGGRVSAADVLRELADDLDGDNMTAADVLNRLARRVGVADRYAPTFAKRLREVARG